MPGPDSSSKTNPYRTPESASEDSSNPSERIPFFGALHWLCLAIALTLIVSALYHRSLLGDLNAYRNSIAIKFEFASLLLCLLCIPANVMAAFYVLVLNRKKLKQGLASLLVCVLLIAALILALLLDSSTLIYMT